MEKINKVRKKNIGTVIIFKRFYEGTFDEILKIKHASIYIFLNICVVHVSTTLHSHEIRLKHVFLCVLYSV